VGLELKQAIFDWIFSVFFDIICLMVVNYFGNGCFRLQSGETSILLDPENNRLKADIFITDDNADRNRARRGCRRYARDRFSRRVRD
jgi:hypothetical protein